jgi:DNA-binding transcriptional ArsR family regulator
MTPGYHSTANGINLPPLSAIPEELSSLDQWVLWRVLQRKDRETKVPFQAKYPSRMAKTNSPSTWSDFASAADVADRNPVIDGVGFVFAPDDGLTGIDFDNCVGEDGVVDEWVDKWLRRLGGYQELSPSSRGVHAIVKARLPGKGKNDLVDGHAVELYDKGRFFTISGRVLGLRAVPEHAQETVDELYSLLDCRADDHGVRHGRHDGRRGGRGETFVDDGGPIPDGRRNSTLVKVCGRLHDGSRTVGDLCKDLMAVNLSRCTPPLDAEEVFSIARRIHRKDPCTPTAPKVTEQVLSVLDRLQEIADRRPVRGTAGATGWSIYNALLDLGRRYGREHERGVDFYADYRTVAQAAGVGSTTTVGNFIQRSPLLEVLRRGSGRRSTRLLLVAPRQGAGESAQTVHSIHDRSKAGRSEQFGHLFKMLYRLRWSTRSAKDRHGLIKGTSGVRQMATGGREGNRRIGKSDAAVLAATMERGEMRRGEIAEALGRSANAMSKSLKRLTDLGLMVRVKRGIYRVSEDLQRRVEDLRVLGDEDKADRLQIARHACQRQAYRTRHERKTDRAPTEAEMDARVSRARPDLIEALGDYLRKVPHRVKEKASWLAVALWSENYVDYRPDPEEVSAALLEVYRTGRQRGAA